MATTEAPGLPALEMTRWLRLPGNLAGPGGAPMIAGPMPEVLMLRCSLLSHREVRGAARRAGLTFSIEFAETRREVLDALRSGRTDVMLVGCEGLPDLDLRELLERANSVQPPVPVVVIGGAVEESESLRLLREGAAEYLQGEQVERLPSAIERALRAREAAAAQARSLQEVDRAATALRENQKLITVGRLAASIAHEINNPLESVINLLYLLSEEKELSDSARNYLALARRELDRVAQISRQTLNFSRETAGPARARVDELLDEVLALYSRRISEKNLRVERQYECREEAMVYPGEMRQVLSNLVTNAVEASSENGRLRLRVRCSRSWSDPGVRGVRISIGDNGSGIEPAVQRRLGEPFFTTKGQSGTGLGLWVTRSIVHRYGGEIELRSSTAPGRHGTVFSIFLPTNLGPRMVERLRGPKGGERGEKPDADPVRTEAPATVRRPLVSEMPSKRRVNGE
ncbi:MAG: HAMP domain-containing sensor histidine kinase [Acidobacteriaceae bacterium]